MLTISGHGWVVSSSQCVTGVKRKQNRSGVEEGKKRKTSKYYSGIFSWEGNIVSSSGKKRNRGGWGTATEKGWEPGKSTCMREGKDEGDLG